MYEIAIKIRIQKLLLAGIALTTLLITPNLTLDSINIPKLFTLSLFGSVIFFFLATSGKFAVRQIKPVVLIAIGMFCVFLLVTFLSNSPSWAQFYGEYGRNTGLLAYLCLATFWLASVYVGSQSFGYKVLATLLVTAVANSTYGLFQHFGLDPIDWQNPYDPITGTLGNPNFTSALLGMGASVGACLLLTDFKIVTKLLLAVFVLTSLFLIWQSDAQQGLLVFLAGLTLIIYFRFFTNKNLVIRLSFVLTVFVSAILGILGLLQRGPLSGLLYQSSVTYRGDYWRAGWKMTLENPLIGVGMDQYGDFYRASRTLDATLRRGPDLTSNSAHNVFLDISSFGGFPLLAAYLLIVSLAIRSSYRLLARSQNYDFVAVGLSAAYLGYLIQSLVSINQLGLAIWGWVLPGAIIGYEMNLRKTVKSNEAKVLDAPHKVPAHMTVVGFLGLMTGFLVMIGPVQKDAAFLDGLSSQNGAAILEASLKWPRDVYYLDFASRIFAENEMYDNALKLSKLAVSYNPRHFRSWEAIYSNPLASDIDRKSALSRMQALDPFNPEIAGDK